MGVKSQLIGLIAMALSFTNLAYAETSPSSGIPTGISTSEEIISGGNRERDSLVLVDFYTQSRGTTWFLKWDLTAPISQWAGISLDSTGCVSCIDLDGQGGCTISVGGGNGLSGVITPRIGELKGLKHLILGNNRLSGKIPESVFEIPNIMTVDIFANEMIGPLPATVGKAANLMTLSLAGNNLDGELPPEIKGMINLKDLLIDNNRFKGPIPKELGDAVKLTRIRFNNNNFTGPLPAEIGNLTELTSINMAENQLSGMIPPEIGRLVKLQDLILANNNLEEYIPVEIGNLAEVKRLRLCHNRLIGPLPSQIGNLINMEQFWANDNNLEGIIPTEIGNCISLSDVRLDENNLNGEIPVEVTELENLRRFNVSFNNLTGPLPATLKKLSKLQELHISDNQLTGPLPARLDYLLSVKIIRAENNQFIGPLPSSVVKLERLREFNLANNNIDGSIPSEYGEVSTLKKLNLENNNLKGCFPESLLNKCDEEFLFMGNTELPWLGQFLSYCSGEEQIGAKCSTETGATGETIQDDCSCSAYLCSPHNLVQDAFICDTETITIAGIEYNESGQITENLMNVGGCDSIVTYNIVRMDVNVTTENTSCMGSAEGSAIVNVTAGGLFDYSLYNAENELVTEGNQVAEIPSFENILGAGDYRLVIIENNLDCNVSRNFTIGTDHGLVAATEVDEIKCEGEYLTINGTTYDENNLSGTEVFSSVHGCDSLVNINLNYFQMEVTAEDASCGNNADGKLTYDINIDLDDAQVTILAADGSEVNSTNNISSSNNLDNLEAGTYTLILESNHLSCNYEETFIINALNVSSDVTNNEYELCPGEVVLMNGVTYSVTNPTGTETLTSVHGCDSIVNISLSYLTLPEAITNEYQLCPGETLELNGVTYSEANLYGSEMYASAAGCDSTVNISLSYLQLPDAVTEEYMLCPGETIELNGVTYSESNLDGTETLTSANGCDSTVHVSLSYIEMPDATDDIFLSNEDSTYDVIANDYFSPGAQVSINILEYEYLDNVTVDNRNRVIVEVDDNYSGKSSFTYEICAIDCELNCVTAKATITNKGDGYDEDILTPNQDGHNDILVVTGYSEYETIPSSRINIINRWGQVVYSTENYSNDWSGNMDNNPSKPLPEGVYYYHLIYTNGKSIMGSRSLIR